MVTIDEEFDAIDIRRVVGGEELHRLGDLLGSGMRPAGIWLTILDADLIEKRIERAAVSWAMPR